jgi:hypothetical protein
MWKACMCGKVNVAVMPENIEIAAQTGNEQIRCNKTIKTNIVDRNIDNEIVEVREPERPENVYVGDVSHRESRKSLASFWFGYQSGKSIRSIESSVFLPSSWKWPVFESLFPESRDASKKQIVCDADDHSHHTFLKSYDDNIAPLSINAWRHIDNLT